MRHLVILLAVIPATFYPIIYARRPWTQTAPGRALMVKSVGNLLLVDTAAILWFWPSFPFRTLLATAGAFVFTFGLWFLLIALIRTPRTPRT